MKQLTFEEWLEIGMAMSWCGPVVCAQHDGVPTSRFEDEESFDGDEPCIWIIRKYENEPHRLSVEDNHAPSVWRRQ